MNDFDYENLQKKRIAQNATRMKRGSKSKRCTLPSDLLTPAQIKKKNGEVKVMNMNKPVLWSDFKDWPADIQKEYLDKRMCDFDCTMSALAEIFDVDVVKLRKTLVDIGFDMRRFMAGRKMTKENRERMLAWIAETRGHTEPIAKVARAKMAKKIKKLEDETEQVLKESVVTAEPEPETEAVSATESEAECVVENTCVAKHEDNEPTKMCPDALMKTPFVKMDFLGRLNPVQIANTLLALAKDRDVKVSLTIEYQEV